MTSCCFEEITTSTGASDWLDNGASRAGLNKIEVFAAVSDLEALRGNLSLIPAEEIAVSEFRSYRIETLRREVYRGAEYECAPLRAKIEILLRSEFVPDAVRILSRVACRIFVYEVAREVDLRLFGH